MTSEHDRNGRPLEQQTKDGTSSAGTFGTGSTGDIGRQTSGGGSQQQVRTVDLLSSGSEQEDAGYLTGGSADLQTGMGGIGSLAQGQAGNQQAEGIQQPGGLHGAMQSDPGNEASERAPESGGQRTEKPR